MLLNVRFQDQIKISNQNFIAAGFHISENLSNLPIARYSIMHIIKKINETRKMFYPKLFPND